jgi:hypothetical protein
MKKSEVRYIKINGIIGLLEKGQLASIILIPFVSQ